MKLCWQARLFVLLTVSAASIGSALPQTVGQKEIAGVNKGVHVNVLVQSPADNPVPLQIACLFEYQEGETFSGAIQEIDQKLGGALQKLRKSGQFSGQFLETILLTPPPGTVPAKNLLLIGLGDRGQFGPERLRMVGRIGLREALRLHVSRYSHASDLRDAGVDKVPVGVAAEAVVSGMLDAYSTEQELQQSKLAPKGSLVEFIYLSGIPYFKDTVEGAKRAAAAR